MEIQIKEHLFVDRVIRLTYFTIALLIRPFVKVKHNRIICWSYNFSKYACNPRVITEYILNNEYENFEIYWAFKGNAITSEVHEGIKVLNKDSFRYLIILYSSRFIINNMRNDYMESYFIKKHTQKYIMTWHASMSLKKIEKDAESQLGKHYVGRAKSDSSMCDLMLSGCRFHSLLFKNSFWYKGEILEKGTPRCDVLFKDPSNIRKELFDLYGIKQNVGIILYAPTFRRDYNLDNYKLEWFNIITELKKKESRDYVVFIRLHPNFLFHRNIDIKKYMRENVFDVTSYPEMQNLLLVSDYLVTDYSSSMFDFSLLGKPCFIYAKDYMNYDRGFYFKLNE